MGFVITFGLSLAISFALGYLAAKIAYVNHITYLEELLVETVMEKNDAEESV